MRHFAHLAPAERRRLFAVEPTEFGHDAVGGMLSVALGATLYMPGDRRQLADDLDRVAARGVVSTVVCLEDAIADGEVVSAEANVVTQLRLLGSRRRGATDAGPLVFVRVRHP